MSDAKLGFEKVSGEVISNDEYEKLWQMSVFGESELFKIEKIYAQNYLYRGYDTSVADGKSRIKNPVILTKMGTSLLISFDRNNKTDAISKLNEIRKNGIGNDKLNGYGAVEICNRIHMIGGSERND